MDSHQSVVWDAMVTNNTNDHLVRLDKEGALPEPELATGWEFSAGGTKITFPLQDGVKFSDGQTLDCTDVQYSFQRIIFPPEGMVSVSKGQFEPVISVECPDPLTVVFNLKSPWSDALVNIATPNLIIYPEHVARLNDATGKFMKNTVIGSGPFKLKRRVVAENVVLERNPLYRKSGLPYLDGIELVSLPPEFRRWSAAFKAGRLDMIWDLDAPLIAEEMRQEGGDWTLIALPKILFVNFIPDQHPGSIWQDIEVRKAAALALIQDEFIETMCPIAMVCWFPSPLTFANPFNLSEEEMRAIPGYGKDASARRAEARQILERKGLVGHAFKIFSRNDLGAFRDSSIVACDLLDKVGFNCTFGGMETGPYYDMVGKRQIPAGDAVVHSVGIYASNTDGIVSHAYHPDGARNYGDYTDGVAELRTLFRQQSQELDAGTRETLMKEYQTNFLELYHHTLLGWRGWTTVHWNYVHNIKPTNNSFHVLNWADVWMEPK